MSEDVKVHAEDEKQLEEETSTNETETKDDVQSKEQQEVEDSQDETTDDADSEPVEREVYTMPVSKAQEEKKRAVEKAKEEARAEAEQEIAKLRQEYEAKLNPTKQETAEYESDLDKVAAEHGLEPSAAKAFAEAIKGTIKLPDLSKYDRLIEQQEIAEAKTQVSTEFDESVIPIIKKDFPNATPEQIAEVKERVSELAFTKGYNTYKIKDIYRAKMDEFNFKSGYTAETSGGHSTELVDFNRMTDTEEHELAKRDPEKYRQYIAYMRGKGSRYTD